MESQITDRLSTLGHPQRLAVFRLLMRRYPDRVPATEIARALGLKLSALRFAHGAEHQLEGGVLVDSYHCSRYNTNTGRLTEKMFEEVFESITKNIN